MSVSSIKRKILLIHRPETKRSKKRPIYSLQAIEGKPKKTDISKEETKRKDTDISKEDIHIHTYIHTHTHINISKEAHRYPIDTP